LFTYCLGSIPKQVRLVVLVVLSLLTSTPVSNQSSAIRRRLILSKNFADSDDEEHGADDIVKKSAGFPKLGALKEEEEDQVLRGSNFCLIIFYTFVS
jgi:hypothetical protein